MENYQYLDKLGLDSQSLLDDLASIVQEGPEKSYQPSEQPPGINEKLVRCLWVDLMFHKDQLKTVGGQKLKVLSPGRWNLEGGPDFRSGKVRFADHSDKIDTERIKVGDIEVHLFASSWKTHGHSKDKNYDGVILHVFLWKDNTGEEAITSSGGKVPQLELLPFLIRPLKELKEKVRLYDYPFKNPGSRGQCYEILKRIKAERVGQILDSLGDSRFLGKASNFGDTLSIIEREGAPQARTQHREQLIYSHLLESMGLKNNRLQFCRLATLMDAGNVAKILNTQPSWKRVRILEALLMVKAGFLPLWKLKTNPDKQSKNYLTRLQKAWLAYGVYETEACAYSGDARETLFFKTLAGEDWQYRGMRPANYPARRMAGLSHFLVNCGRKGVFASGLKLFEGQATSFSSIISAIENLFRARRASYWDLRYTFNGKQLPGTVSLIGQEKIAVTLVNVFLPLYFAWAWLNWDIKLGKNIYTLWRLLPAQGRNNITNFMRTRLLGHDKRRWKIINSARRQQALIQVYKRYCQSEETSCEDCAFLKNLTK